MEWRQSRYYKNISLLIKLAIVTLAFGFIYKQVFYRHDRELLEQSLRAAFSSYPLVVLSIALMCGNWLIEAWKWKLLVQRSEPLSLSRSLKAVLSGVTIGAFTPNRFGEFAGRIFYLERTGRAEGVLMTFAGSAAQLLVTLMAGSAALASASSFLTIPAAYREVYWIICVLAVAGSLALLLLYLRIQHFASFLQRISWLKRYHNNIDVLTRFTARELLVILLLSFFRYCIFTFQFYLLLSACDVQVLPVKAIILICITFFVITSVPTVALSELGVRGIAAVSVIGAAANNEAGIAAASFALWIINIALPAIIGAVFVFGMKFFKEKK